jgi:ribosome-associated protein
MFKERAAERLGARLVSGVITVIASEHRSQLRNREAAAARLGNLIAAAVAAPPRSRRATKPTRGSVERRIADKKRRAQTKRNRRSDDD